MTVEDKAKAIRKICKEFGYSCGAISNPCPLSAVKGLCHSKGADIDRNYDILVKAGLIAPDDEIETADDKVDEDGMTIEEMQEKLRKYCELETERDGCNSNCPLHKFNCFVTQEQKAEFLTDDDKAEIRQAYATITAPNFTKANPDDAVTSDAVNHPNHYCKGGIECIDAIKASMTADGFCDYCKGNVIKYLWRWRDKGGVEDLHKARVYLDWLIEAAKGASDAET